MCASHKYLIYEFMFMCEGTYFIVYASYSNFITAHVSTCLGGWEGYKSRRGGSIHIWGRYTQNSTFSCEHGICAFIGSVATDVQRNTGSGTWGQKCVDIGRHCRSGYTETFYNWRIQMIRGHYRIVDTCIHMNMAISVHECVCCFVLFVCVCVCCFVLLTRYWGIVTVPGSFLKSGDLGWPDPHPSP